MNVLVLACLTDGTGNAVTARRIATHLEGQHRVTLVDTCEIGGLAALRALAAREGVERVVAVHALLAGPFARRLGLPYVLVLGGTDLYEPAHELHRREMADAVAGAETVVAFGDANAARAGALWPSAPGKTVVIPQAVDVSGASDFDVRATIGASSTDRVFVVAAGIRAVKDPAFLAEAFAAWRAQDPAVRMVVIGPVLDEGFAPACLARLAAAGVDYLGGLPRPDLLAALRDADAVVNTSVSEGMCGVLLEAMALGTPVFARANAGNAALLEDGVDGVLFETPEAFVAAASADVDGPVRARRAAAVIARDHGPARERAGYLDLVTSRRSRAA